MVKRDANTKIVSTTLDIAKYCPAIVVADTDVAVMLLYHWNEELFEVFFLQERGKKCWSIKESKLEVADIKGHLLFVHAWTDCSSTSAIPGKGKPSFVNFIKNSENMKCISETLMDYCVTQAEVEHASVKGFKELYSGIQETS